jgi:hypothetical protein
VVTEIDWGLTVTRHLPMYQSDHGGPFVIAAVRADLKDVMAPAVTDPTKNVTLR